MSPNQTSAVVLTDVIGQKAGAYRASLLLCQELAAMGYRTDCLATWVERDGFPANSGFALHTPFLKRGSRWDLPNRSLALQASRFIRRRNPNWVVCVGITRLCRYLLQSSIADRVCCWELTNGTGNHFVDGEAIPLLSRSRAVLAPTKIVESNIRQHYEYEGRIERLPFWIEDDSRSYAAAPNNFDHDFLFLGRRVVDKGLNDLVDAAKVVSGVRIAVGGFGDATPFRQRADNASVGNRVEFVELPCRDDAMKLLSRCRYLVLPSHHEGYGLVLLEAARLCVPVIATAVDSIPELFGDCEGCRLVPPRDPGALAGVLASAMAEPAESYEARRRAIYARFAELSARDTICRRIESVIERVGS